MSDHRCPNCENDLTDVMMGVIVAKLRAGESGTQSMTCPHCDEPLTIDVTVNATVSRQTSGAAY